MSKSYQLWRVGDYVSWMSSERHQGVIVRIDVTMKLTDQVEVRRIDGSRFYSSLESLRRWSPDAGEQGRLQAILAMMQDTPVKPAQRSEPVEEPYSIADFIDE